MADVRWAFKKRMSENQDRLTAQRIVTTETLDIDDWHPHLVQRLNLGSQWLGDVGGCTVGIQEKVSERSQSKSIYLHLQNLSFFTLKILFLRSNDSTVVTNVAYITNISGFVSFPQEV